MKKKILASVLACVLLIGVGVGGTLAWLADDTDTVTNTFVVGDINISLEESVESNFKIIPGGTDPKDPVLTVEEESELCYVYVCVENNVVLDGVVVATPNISGTDWVSIGTSGTKTVYRYAGNKATDGVVDAYSAAVELDVFTEVSYSEDIEKGDIGTLANTTIVISGYAHQSENVDLADADAAALEHFEIPTT